MINTEFSKRIMVTLPLNLISKMDKYRKDHWSAGYSELVKYAVELYLGKYFSGRCSTSLDNDCVSGRCSTSLDNDCVSGRCSTSLDND